MGDWKTICFACVGASHLTYHFKHKYISCLLGVVTKQ